MKPSKDKFWHSKHSQFQKVNENGGKKWKISLSRKGGGDCLCKTPKGVLKEVTIGFFDTCKKIDPDGFQNKCYPAPRKLLMGPLQSGKYAGHDNKQGHLIVRCGDIIGGRFKVVEKCGEGLYGIVYECFDLLEREQVALKIIRSSPHYSQQALSEIKFLKVLRRNKHLSNLRCNFVHLNHQCLSFDLMNLSLLDLLRRREFGGVSLDMIGMIATQMLEGLDLLHSEKYSIVHLDLKPENVMIPHNFSKGQPVQLIDFSNAIYAKDLLKFHQEEIQSRFYRSPEVILGCVDDFSTSLDMWSFGCIMAEMFLGLPIFSSSNHYDQMKRMITVLNSFPPFSFIERGKFSMNLFRRRPPKNKKTGPYRFQLKRVIDFQYQVGWDRKVNGVESLINNPSWDDHFQDLRPTRGRELSIDKFDRHLYDSHELVNVEEERDRREKEKKKKKESTGTGTGTGGGMIQSLGNYISRIAGWNFAGGGGASSEEGKKIESESDTKLTTAPSAVHEKEKEVEVEKKRKKEKAFGEKKKVPPQSSNFKKVRFLDRETEQRIKFYHIYRSFSQSNIPSVCTTPIPRVNRATVKKTMKNFSANLNKKMWQKQMEEDEREEDMKRLKKGKFVDPLFQNRYGIECCSLRELIIKKWKQNKAKIKRDKKKRYLLDDAVAKEEGVMTYRKQMLSFIDFLKKVLHWIPRKRMSAKRALVHPFILDSKIRCHFDKPKEDIEKKKQKSAAPVVCPIKKYEKMVMPEKSVLEKHPKLKERFLKLKEHYEKKKMINGETGVNNNYVREEIEEIEESVFDQQFITPQQVMMENHQQYSYRERRQHQKFGNKSRTISQQLQEDRRNQRYGDARFVHPSSPTDSDQGMYMMRNNNRHKTPKKNSLTFVHPSSPTEDGFMSHQQVYPTSPSKNRNGYDNHGMNNVRRSRSIMTGKNPHYPAPYNYYQQVENEMYSPPSSPQRYWSSGTEDYQSDMMDPSSPIFDQMLSKNNMDLNAPNGFPQPPSEQQHQQSGSRYKQQYRNEERNRRSRNSRNHQESRPQQINFEQQYQYWNRPRSGSEFSPMVSPGHSPDDSSFLQETAYAGLPIHAFELSNIRGNDGNTQRGGNQYGSSISSDDTPLSEKTFFLNDDEEKKKKMSKSNSLNLPVKRKQAKKNPKFQ